MNTTRLEIVLLSCAAALLIASFVPFEFYGHSKGGNKPMTDEKEKEERRPSPTAPTISETRPPYKDYKNLVFMMKNWESEANGFVEVGTYGKTTKDIDQYYVKITNKSVGGKKPSCVITGCIHGNEPISTCTEVWWITTLLSSYATDPRAKEILDTREIYFIPVLSPDTYPHSRHVDGVDPNRNFPSSGEKQSVVPIENFKNFFKVNKFNAFITGHSYGRVFMFATERDPERREAYERIKKDMDSISSYKATWLGGPNTTLDGDWGNRQGAFSLLVEFGTHQRIPSPEDIETEFKATYESILYFLKEAPVAFATKCGSGEIEEEFSMDADFERVASFVCDKKKDILKEMNIEFLEDMKGGRVKLKRKNSRGTFVWVARETFHRQDGVFHYKSNLEECISGGVERMDCEVKISKFERGCRIKASVSASVEDVSSKDIRFDIKMKCRRIKRMILAEFERSLVSFDTSYPIRVLILKHSKEKMADDDAAMVMDAVNKANRESLNIQGIGNHFIHDTKKIRASIFEVESYEPESLKEFVSQKLSENPNPDGTSIIMTIGHGSPSGGLHNLGKREEVQKALAEAAEDNAQKVLWWQLSCYSAAKLPDLNSLTPSQQKLFSVLNTSNENTPSPAYIEGKIMEKLFGAMLSEDNELDKDGNNEVTGREFRDYMNTIRKGRGDLLRSSDMESPLFGLSLANRIAILDQGQFEFKEKNFIPQPRKRN